MRIATFVLIGVTALWTLPCWAQRPAEKKEAKPAATAPAAPAPTAKTAVSEPKPVPPEVWLYQESLRQYLDPQLAVRKKAEARAEARENRLTAMRWFGFSNIRPRAATDPMHTDYSPRWSSNNTAYPYQWNGVGPGYAYLVEPRSVRY